MVMNHVLYIGILRKLRVVHSIIAAETLSLVDGCDVTMSVIWTRTQRT